MIILSGIAATQSNAKRREGVASRSCTSSLRHHREPSAHNCACLSVYARCVKPWAALSHVRPSINTRRASSVLECVSGSSAQDHDLGSTFRGENSGWPVGPTCCSKRHLLVIVL